MVQVFESHAEILSQKSFSLYSLPYLREIATRVKAELGDDAVPMVSLLKTRQITLCLPITVVEVTLVSA